MVRAAQFYCDIQKQAGAEQSMQPQHRDPFVCPVLEESQLGGTGKYKKTPKQKTPGRNGSALVKTF